MNQDEQERVDIVLSEIQCILAELSATQKQEQTNAPAVVVSELIDVKAEQSESAISLTPHRTNDAAFVQEIEALLGISQTV